MSILSCKLVSVTGGVNAQGKNYTTKHRVRTDSYYGPNQLIIDAQAESNCVRAYGATWPGIPEISGAADQADAGASLLTIKASDPIYPKGDEAGYFEYILTQEYKTPPAPPAPNGESSCDPLDWCPTYFERSNAREDTAEKARFAGLYKVGDFAGNPCNTAPDNCQDPTLSDIAPYGGGIFRVDRGECRVPVNTAGDYLVGGDSIVKQMSDTQVDITYWQTLAAFDPDEIRAVRDTVNANEIQLSFPCWGGSPLITIAPGTAMFEAAWELKKRTCEASVLQYFEISISFFIRHCGWCKDLQNKGYNRMATSQTELDGYGGTFSPYTGNQIGPPGRQKNVPIISAGEDGKAVVDPQFLDANGQPLQHDAGLDDVLFSRWCPQAEATWDFI